MLGFAAVFKPLDVRLTLVISKTNLLNIIITLWYCPHWLIIMSLGNPKERTQNILKIIRFKVVWAVMRTSPVTHFFYDNCWLGVGVGVSISVHIKSCIGVGINTCISNWCYLIKSINFYFTMNFFVYFLLYFNWFNG